MGGGGGVSLNMIPGTHANTMGKLIHGKCDVYLKNGYVSILLPDYQSTPFIGIT